MKPKRSSIFSRIILLIAGLITVLAAVFIAITYFVAINYYDSSTQLLNKDVAAHIAEFTAPFSANGLNKRKADSVFHDAMVLSPNSEVYFLDTAGAVIDFYEKSKQPSIRQWKIPLDAIQKHIAAGGKDYIKSPDPRDPEKPKIFAAAEVRRNGRKLGYIYVILASSEARTVAAALQSNHVIILSIAAFACIIILSLALSFLYVGRIQRRFGKVVNVLERFQQGDFDARFQISRQDGLAPIKGAFNTMADLLVYHINRLTKSEAERKAFIAGITHDLRNPLSIAGGYAETLLMKTRQGTLTPQQQDDYAKLMLQKMRQVENMVEQLHDLSTLESVTYTPKREPFMFSELLQEVVHAFQQQADEKSLTVDCEDCKDDAYINADVGMMERVLQNLIDNAIAYSPEKAGVALSLRREALELILRVENSGSLPQQLIQWLSEQDSSTYSPMPQAPSLGLSIVKRILHIHQYPLTARNAGASVVFEVSMSIYPTSS